MKKSKTTFENKGFSLLEVIVSLIIFSFIGIYITQNVRSSVKSRKNFYPKMEENFRARSSFLLIKKDINQAFHFKDFYITTYNQAITEFKKTYAKELAKKAKKDKKRIEIPPKEIKESTFFKGDASEFSFTSLSSLDNFSLETPFAVNIKYGLEPCKGLKSQEQTDCLVRKEWIFGQEEPTDSEVKTQVLLENVQSLELFYLKENSDEKLSQWSSLEEGYQNQFPSAVEVLIELKSKKKLKWILSVHFSNNQTTSQEGPASK